MKSDRGHFPAYMIRANSAKCRQIQTRLLAEMGLGNRHVKAFSPWCWDCHSFIAQKGPCPGLAQKDLRRRPQCFVVPAAEGQEAAA